jgi:[methyl-Co(III) methanol-specific corrinoid protein]:coenzyme M methyltransferase
MNAKERILAVLNHQKPDRMPCFGANSTVTYDQMENVQAFWPEGHENGEIMAKQASAAYTELGFDAVRIPFSQTFESEALGCKLKPGKAVDGSEGIPGIDHPPPYTLDDSIEFPDDFLSRGKIPELLKAVRILKKELGDEVMIVAGIIGRAGTALAKALVEAGADMICCEDMTASPMLISPGTYRDYELEFQRKQFEAITVPKILHICGKVDQIVEWMGQTGADILSIEPKADAKLAREKCGEDVILMGGVDTANTLFMQDAQTVKQMGEQAVAEGIQILAPGCAVAPGTPMENLKALVELAKAH